MFTLQKTKIAVPTREGVVDDHFGHCAYYTIFSVIGTTIVEQSTMPSPQGCGCKSNIAEQLRADGVEVMLAGNMGDGAKRVLERNNIRIVRGCSGAVVEVVKAYLAGNLNDKGESCDHHNCAHH